MFFSFYYNNIIENLSILFAVIYFLMFLIVILCAKIASGKDCYSKLHRCHIKIYLLYIFTLSFIVIYRKEFNFHFFIGFLVGSFIYFSLHYIYLFFLIGLAKKSISINILATIKELESENIIIDEEKLVHRMYKNDIGLGSIRENRLLQMVILKFATFQEDKYRLTVKGKIVHYIGFVILKIWNQKRL